MNTGSKVRILEDEYPGLVGMVGELVEFGPDRTTAWVVKHPPFGVWCSVANLEEVEE